MKKRFLCLLFSFVLVLSFIPMTAITANAVTVSMADEVYVGTIALEDGEYILEGEIEKHDGRPPENASYAYFKDRVLHLKNFDLSSHVENKVASDTTVECSIGIWQCIPGLLINDFTLTINLIGENRITDTESEYSIYTHRASGVIFTGNGSLEANRPMAAAAGLTINSGNIRIIPTATDDYSNNMEAVRTSGFQMNGGSLTVKCVNRDGIDCESVNISSGSLDVEVKGRNDSINPIGIKSSGAVSFTGGTAKIVADGDAVQCSSFNVKDGIESVKLVSAAKEAQDNNFAAVNADFISLPATKAITSVSNNADGSNAVELPVGTDDLEEFDFVEINKSKLISGTVRGVESNTKITISLYKAGSDTPLKTTTVTGNGTYSFGVVETGKYTVKATAEGYAPFSYTFTLTDFPNSGLCYINMLKSDITISGTISGVENDTVTTVTLYLYGSDTPLQTTTVTGNGTYSFAGVACDNYAIRARAAGYSSPYHTTPLIVDDYTHNFVLESKTYFIAGNITGVKSDTVTTVSLYPSGFSAPVKTTTVTGEGYYIIEAAVGAGNYTIKATASGYSTHTEELTLGNDTIVSHHIAMKEEKPAFTKQPVGGEVAPGEKLTVYWELNFTPVKVELRKLRSGFRTFTTDLGADATSTDVGKYTGGHYVIRAYYNDTEYVDSDKFYVTEKEESVLKGDVNHDGVVSNADLIAVARYIVGLTNEIDLNAADMDDSGSVANSDLIAIARIIVGLN